MTNKLRSILRGKKGVVTRILMKFEAVLTEDSNPDDLITIEESLRGHLQTITGIHEKIIDSIPDENDAEIEEETIQQAEKEYVYELQTKIQRIANHRKVTLSNLNASSLVFSSTTPAESMPTVIETSSVTTPTENVFNHQPRALGSAYHRLPKLELPKFSGYIIEWQSFWDSFEAAIHVNQSLSAVQKFNYLKTSLYGEAANTIAGFTLTNSNYEKAVALLHERFGQKDRIVEKYMQALIEVPVPQNTPSSLRSFYDCTESYIRGLESLDQPQNTYGSLLAPIVMQKLPSQVKQNMTREHGVSSWSLRDVMDSLLKEIKILDAGSIGERRSDEFVSTASILTETETQSTKQTRVTTEPNYTKPTIDKSCVFCKGQHPSYSCMFVRDRRERVNIIKKAKLCFNCLGKHKVAECRSKFKCRSCAQRHHTSLCTGNKVAERELHTIGEHSRATNPQTSVLHTTHAVPKGPVLLKTAQADVKSNDACLTANILFDEGAQSSFMSEKLAQKLNVHPTGKETISLSGFGDTNRRMRQLETTTILISSGSENIPINVMIVPEISVPLQTYQNQAAPLTYLKGLKLAHPVSDDEEFPIELLVGADHYWDIVGDKIIRGHGPTATESKLGYLLSGPLRGSTPHSVRSPPISMMYLMTSHGEEEIDLEKFWKVESLGIEDPKNSAHDETYLSDYQDNCISFKDGKYTAKLPWKADHPILPSNERITKSRTIGVINRLRRDPAVLGKYDTIIRDQENRGFIERVPASEIGPCLTKQVHYIPHHPVKKDSVTTPIRIVYDCSCKSSHTSPSLNDCLMNTPPQLNDLTSLLIRFRNSKYGVRTDIEKAFLNVTLHEDDRDVTRFFWTSDINDRDSPLQMYRFKSVLFGATCSPFILNAVIIKHLNTFRFEETQCVRDSLYVDNILTSIPDESALINFYNNSRQLFQKAGFNLRSWASNNKTLQTLSSAENVSDQDETTKVLGMLWNTNSDVMSFPKRPDVRHSNDLFTKREVLKVSSVIFDPLGLLSPVTVRSKMFMQSLWQRKLDWDEILPDDAITEWRQIHTDIVHATNTSFHRQYFRGEIGTEGTLHIFTDASVKAYGACAYIVSTSGKESTLIMAKNRVSPLKQMTIPKLELSAAVLGARLCQHITSSIKCKEVFLWSDSQIVLSWIASTKKLPMFVTNRVQEIQSLTNHYEWRYCPTDTNPADLLSRGMSFEKYQHCSLWFHGPKWLTDNNNSVPTFTNTHSHVDNGNEQDVHVTDPSEKCTTMLVNATETGIFNVIDIDRYSSYNKLLRVAAYVRRFIDNCRKTEKTQGILKPCEMNEASKLLIKDVQHQQYPEVTTYITRRTGQRLTTPNLVKQLNLYLDDDSIIRCGGRIANAPLTERTKFPYLLPSKHKLTDMIIADAHRKQLHSGTESTVTFLRQSFWIPGIRERVRAAVRTCVTCRKVTGQPYRVPDPPPLPTDRLQLAPPFTVTGVDFTGALTVKNRAGTTEKAYICLFTCANTRAVHLEIVPNMSVDSFTLALRRFISRRSAPKVIMSDNALTFLATSRILNEEIFNTNGITWKFIPQHAPWYGGFWERMIGVTKTCIKKVLGRSLVSVEVLQTIITEVECIINDRPLTHTSSDPLDQEPLTPSHLLYGRRITTPTYPDDRSDSNIEQMSQGRTEKLFRFKCATIQRFWTRWRQEYLTSLREHQRLAGRVGDTVNIGDVVQIHDDNHQRMRWTLGVIDDVITGGDGETRAARVRTNRGVTTRPVAKLYPLEVK